MAIASALILPYTPLVASAESVRICGVSFQDADLNYTIATYLPNLAAVQGTVSRSKGQGASACRLPWLPGCVP